MEENQVEDCRNEGKIDSVDEDSDHGSFFDMDAAFPEEFEFRISVSRAPGVSNTVDLISPADELFYKGQLLPLHLPPRIQMVQNLVSLGGSEAGAASDSLNSESFWSKDSTNSDSSCSTSSNSSSRDSSGSSQDSECCDSGGLINAKEKTQFPSWRKSAARFKGSLLNLKNSSKVSMDEKQINAGPQKCKTSDQLLQVPSLSRDSSRGTESNRVQKKTYHSLSFSDRFSSMDKEREKTAANCNRSAKEIFQKYFRMIKPFYEKRSQKHELRMDECKGNTVKSASSGKQRPTQSTGGVFFSGNLKMGRKRSGGGSCPSSMRSSPNHSGVLVGMKAVSASGSSMEELQNAIQGAIAHCKKSNAITTETQDVKDSSDSS